MKANELMIGNRVLFNDTPYEIIEMNKYEAYLKDNDNCDNDRWVKIMDMEPIKITPELLEKNDWEHHVLGEENDKNKIDYWTSPDHRIELRSNKNHDMCNSDAAWGLHIDNVDFETIGSGEVTYLHELQNEFNCKHYEFEWQL